MTPSPQHSVYVYEFQPRLIPDAVRDRIVQKPSVVEDLADTFRTQGWRLGINLGEFSNPSHWNGIIIGPVVTARYVPKTVPDSEYRLGHDTIASVCSPGAIVMCDANQCVGSVLGGNAAKKLKAGGAGACIVDGMGRDVAEVTDSQLIARTRALGVEGGRTTTELAEIGSPIVIGGVTVRPSDVAIMNQWGLVLVPEWVSWDNLSEWIGV